MVRQQQIDEVVGRIKAAVAKHGQGNPKLQDLQGAYEVLHKTPNDGMALALVEIELEKLGG